MPANLETQFTLFDRPSPLDGHPVPRRKRWGQLPDLVRIVGELGNDELLDLIRVALGEARRRGIGSVPAASDSRQATASGMDQMSPAAARIVRKAAPTADIPPAKASMIRAAVKAGFSPAKVAKDFGVSSAIVRKLTTP